MKCSDQIRQQYLKDVASDYPHNRKVFVLFDAIWGAGVPFAGNSLIPAFMVVMGSSKALIGFYTTLPFLVGFWQIINSHLFRARPKKKWLSLTYTLTVMPWLIYSILFFCWGDSVSDQTKLGLFVLVQAIFWLGSSGSEGVRFSMMTQCTPIVKRGGLIGSRVGYQVVITLIFWPLAVWIMKQWPEPVNFFASFIFASFFFMMCGPTYLLTREHRNPEIIVRYDQVGLRGLWDSVCQIIKEMLRSTTYRRFLMISIVLYSSVRLACFIVVFAKERMHLSGASIIHFTIIQMIASAASSIILGKIADRFGYRLANILLTIPLALGFIVAALFANNGDTSHVALYLSFILSAMGMMVSYLMFMNMSVELMPNIDVGLLVSLSNLLMTPLLLLIVPLGGWIVDVSGSYSIVFWAGAALAIISGLGYVWFIPEPRQAG